MKDAKAASIIKAALKKKAKNPLTPLTLNDVPNLYQKLCVKIIHNPLLFAYHLPRFTLKHTHITML